MKDGETIVLNSDHLSIANSIIQNKVLLSKTSFLQKPFSLKDLLEGVRQVIDAPRRKELIIQ